MLLQLLGLSVNWRRAAALGAAGVVVVLVGLCYLQSVALARDVVVYHNPRIIDRVRVVRVEGPVRIVSRVIETPNRRESVIEEDRGPVTVVIDSAHISEPIFPPAPRLNRWLAGISANPSDLRESRYFGAWGGYSWGNRLDLMAGVNGGRPGVMVVARF